MDIELALAGLKKVSKADVSVREKLLAAAKEKNPVSAFCREAEKLGFPIDPMDLASFGEEEYAAMRRSTNGGGENSPMLSGEDDGFAMFLEELKA